MSSRRSRLAPLVVVVVSLASGARAEEVIVVTADADTPSHVVTFELAAPLKEKNVTVVQIGGTYLRTVQADLLEPDAASLSYRAALQAYPAATSRGWDDVAVIAPAKPDARVIKLSGRERSALLTLRHEAFARVTHVFDNGVSFARGKPDVAFLEVCVEYPAGDAVCGATTVYAARKQQSGTWTLVACGKVGTCGMDVDRSAASPTAPPAAR